MSKKRITPTHQRAINALAEEKQRNEDLTDRLITAQSQLESLRHDYAKINNEADHELIAGLEDSVVSARAATKNIQDILTDVKLHAAEITHRNGTLSYAIMSVLGQPQFLANESLIRSFLSEQIVNIGQLPMRALNPNA